MLKPSDFNNAVPQFQNGNYASNPINPQYVEEPSSTDYNRGTEPLQTLPAQWWNWFMNKFTSRFNKVNIYVKNLFNELAQLLSLVNVTPDGTEGAVTDGQLKNAFKELYPNYINTKLALEAIYVKKTQKVNNHALSGDVTVTKSDVGLGNVANTGDSATPINGGTTKFTTGGAYTELNKKVDKSSVTSTVESGNDNPVTSGGVYDIVMKRRTVRVGEIYSKNGYFKIKVHGWYARPIEFTVVTTNGVYLKLIFGQSVRNKLISLGNTIAPNTGYKFINPPSNDSDGYLLIKSSVSDVATEIFYTATFTPNYTNLSVEDSSAEEFEEGEGFNLVDINNKADLDDIAPAFSTSTSYAVGDMVTYNGILYTCTTAHSAGTWDASHFTDTNLNTEFQKNANNIAVNFTTGRSYSKGELVIYGKELYRCKNNTLTHVSAWDPSIFEKTNLVNTEQRFPGLYILNTNANVSSLFELPELPAGSELLIRMDNQSSSSRTITLKATKKYVLGILGGFTSSVRTLQINETYAQEVASGGYLEVRINYIEVDDGGPGFLNGSLLAFPLPTVNNYYI